MSGGILPLTHIGLSLTILKYHVILEIRKNKRREKLKYRENEVGIPMISKKVRDQIFGKEEKRENPQYTYEAIEELKKHNLYPPQVEKKPPLEYELPDLLGENIQEHWEKLGYRQAQPYLGYVEKLLNATPPPLPKWKKESGWTKYEGEKVEPVPYPNEKAIIFDVETCVKESNYAVMATALSATAWYMWLSPALFNPARGNHLIPLGEEEKIVVAHYANYDIARVKGSYAEEYKLDGVRYIDTFSMHTAIAGMSSRQRLIYKSKAKEKPAWCKHTCPSSLKDLVYFYTKEEMDKSARNTFVEGTYEDVDREFEELANYNALDCSYLLKVFQKMWIRFREKNPHNVTFAGMLSMSREFLPVEKKIWENYKTRSNKAYRESNENISDLLKKLAKEAIEQWKEKGSEEMQKNPWLRHLDWSKPSSRARKMKNSPNWYRALDKKGKIYLTAAQDVAKYLLRLEWKGFPVYKHPEYKWGYLVPKDSDHENTNPVYLKEDGTEAEHQFRAKYIFYKIPHKKGASSNVGDILSKDYLAYFKAGILTSKNPEAQKILEEKIKTAYWQSTHGRIEEQFLHVNGEEEGIIIPRLAPFGTITRRATENTWLTASNPKPDKIGSEIKTNVTAPEGYKLVGADVASQEAWISAIFGDHKAFKIQGGTAYGNQCLVGDKKHGTDFHSSTAQILNDAIEEVCGKGVVKVKISRHDAKIFNYSRIYLAGISSTVSTLKELVKGLEEDEYLKVVKKLFAETKGEKNIVGNWEGGKESYTFNYLEELARNENPRTPMLGAGITNALLSKNLNDPNEFLPSRGNWAVQSSGVDFLHCLITATEYLCEEYKIDARLMLSIHDEYRWLCREDQIYQLAWAMQVAHIWTRSLLVYNLGFSDLPESVAWFEEIDVDQYLRKEASDPCKTPSLPQGIEEGETIYPSQTTQMKNNVLV